MASTVRDIISLRMIGFFRPQAGVSTLFYNNAVHLIHLPKTFHSELMCHCVMHPAKADFLISRIIYPAPVIPHADRILMMDFSISTTYSAFLMHTAVI